MNPALMREALALARQGRALASPNPMVGAVLAHGDTVVGQGFHTYAAREHAEIVALAEAGGRARGATLYVNLEPCSHHGRTPPCADALIEAGVARVVAATEDPNPEVGGAGFKRLREAGVEVEIAAEFAAEAAKLNEPFFHFMRTGRPLVTLKTAITLDGKISASMITADGSLANGHARTCRNCVTITTLSSPASAPRSLTTRCSQIARLFRAIAHCCAS